MDGPPLRHVSFRVQHDCPLARLSNELPGVRFTVWSGHGLEVLEVACSRSAWPGILETAGKHVTVKRAFPSAEGGLVVAEVTIDPAKSISRTLEAHDCLWLQPMVLQDGWEHYDAISFAPTSASEQKALDALTRHGPTRVGQRRPIEPQDLTASLFLSLRPVLDAPTDKQAEALVAAGKDGYYRTPRSVTTADVAQHLGLGRSAFEERLRGGENRVLAALLPLLEHRRLR